MLDKRCALYMAGPNIEQAWDWVRVPKSSIRSACSSDILATQGVFPLVADEHCSVVTLFVLASL